MSYYGVIVNIWEWDYTIFLVPVIPCKWAENNNDMKVDELEFILVDLNKEGYKEDTFIFASQTKQVFYITDPVDKVVYCSLDEAKNYTWLWWHEQYWG